MPGNNALPSYIGNLTTARDKMSSVRQRIGLENSLQAQRGQMKAVAPTPPEGADMDVRGAAVGATEAPFQAPEDLMARPIQDHPNYMAMRATAQQFLDENKNGVDDRAEGIAPPNAALANPPAPNDPAGAGVATGTLVNDPKIVAALAPMTEYFKQNGRLPNPEELKDMAAKRQLAAQLGRDPTPDEITLYRTPPPKEVR